MWQKINQLKNLSGFRKYFANTAWLMAERVLRMVVALFVAVYVARYLGPERFGLLSYANSFVGLFLAVATLGLDSIVVRELVKTPERKAELLGTAFGLKIMGAIAMWLVIMAAIPFAQNDNQTNIIIAIIAFSIIFQAFNVIDYNYQAEVKSKHVVHAQMTQLVISSIVKLGFIFIEAPVLWFAFVYCLDAAVLSIGLGITYLYKSGNFQKWRWQWPVAKHLLLESWPLMGSLFMTLIFMNIDKVMIKEIIGVSDVGIYTVAVQLSSACYFIPVVVSDSLFPAIIKSKENQELYISRIKNLFRLLFAISIVLSIGTTFMSAWIIDLLYGYEYHQAASVLIVHIWTSIFVFLGYASTKWLLIEGQQKIQFLRGFFALVTNVVLNYFFIPKYGIIGAAYATLISWIVGMYIFHFFHRSTFDLFLLKTETILFFGLIDLKK